MELRNKKENLALLHDMCLREVQIAKHNIDIYAKKANDVFHSVMATLENSYGTQNCLTSYDSALTDLSQLSDILRKFNLKFELTPVFSSVTLGPEYSDLQLDKEHKQKERFTYPQPDLSKSLGTEYSDLQPDKEHKEIFTYPQPVLGKYKVNYEGDCVITYVKSSGDLLFYINETGNTDYTDCITNLQNYFLESPRAFPNVPNEGIVFGLHLEGYMFRAVRENGLVSTNNFNAYLIDIGEIVNITREMEIYVLPIALQNVPSQAILCKLNSVNYSNDIDLKAYLTENLYVKQKFNVTTREDLLLHVDLRRNTNPFRSSIEKQKNITEEKKDPLSKPITNPFRKYFCVKTQYDNISEDGKSAVSKRVIVEEHHSIVDNIADKASQNCHNYNKYNDCVNFNNNSRRSSSQNINIKDFLECGSSYSDDSIASGRTAKSNINEFNERKCTEDELRLLYEEPLNTTNAMKAVMGYEPKDDKRICQFYNPKTNSCFKGSNCRFEHVEKIKDGWTRDEAETIIDIPNKIIYPANGMTITLKPTHIVNMEHFFAQIVYHEYRYKPTLKELILKMNSPEETLKFKTLKGVPVRFELVLAMFKDGMWYRAKILNVLDDDTLKVFYVDYGNSDIIRLDCTRKWESKFDYLPFQAIPCRLAGVKEKRKKSLEGTEYLRKFILNKAIKATVVNNVDQLEVTLSDSGGADIAEELVKLGYAETQPIVDHVHQDQLLPA